MQAKQPFSNCVLCMCSKTNVFPKQNNTFCNKAAAVVKSSYMAYCTCCQFVGIAKHSTVEWSGIE